MVRVSRRPISALARRAHVRARGVHKGTTRKHKVIMESITQEKKKLRSVMSFEAKAPPGYTFIPAGNPQLTTACKEMCRKDGLTVFAVTTTPHMRTHNLSQHVHRIGYHFPSAVVANVCMEMGLYLTASGKAVPFQGANYPRERRRRESELSQIIINSEARDVLKDLFPGIPENDLNQIIKTAFQKGQHKVGTAAELPLARRAQLAVVAHIRHIYTDYDRLLKTTSFHEARSLVEEPTLAKLVEWRGDDENGKTVLEDVFREVIVISDDEDSDTEGTIRQVADRDYSVEIVASNPRVEDLQTQPVDYAKSTRSDFQLDVSEDDAPPGFRFVREIPRKHKVDRRGFSRYQAWDRAINRYRNLACQTNQQGPLHRAVSHKAPIYTAEPRVQAYSRLDTEPSPPRVMDYGITCAAPRARSNQRPPTSRLNDLSLNPTVPRRPYDSSSGTKSPQERETVPLSGMVSALAYPGNRASFLSGDSPNTPVFVSGPKDISEKGSDYFGNYRRTPGFSHNGNSNNPQDRALPSVETPHAIEDRRQETGLLDSLTKRMSGELFIGSGTPHRIPHRESQLHLLQDNTEEQAVKRRRITCFEPPPPEKSHYDAGPTRVARSYAGEPYIPTRYDLKREPLLWDETRVRRRYVVRAEPPYPTERQSGRSQDHYAPHIADQTWTIGREPWSCDSSEPQPIFARLPNLHPENPRNTREPRQPVSEIHINDSTVDQLSGPGEQRAYSGAHLHSSDVLPGSVAHGDRNIWRTRTNEHIIVPHGAPPRRHYAEDFVRTIDIQDSVSLEHSRQGHVQTSYTGEPSSLVAAVPHCDPYEQDLPHGIIPAPAKQSHLEPRVRTTATLGYTMVENQRPRHRDDIVSRPSTRHYERRFEGHSDIPGHSYERYRSPSNTQQQPRTMYLRALDHSPSQCAASEGRTVIIVD